MKLYRAISEKEKTALDETGSTFLEHKTVLSEEKILYPHPEDYRTGKFFFFNLDEAVGFGRFRYPHEVFYILELEMPDDFDFEPYLCYGVYGYQLYHVEMVLPYEIAGQKLASRNYKLFPHTKFIHVETPTFKNRPQILAKMGDLIRKITEVSNHIPQIKNRVIEELKGSLEAYKINKNGRRFHVVKDSLLYWKNFLTERQNEFKTLEQEFATTYPQFLDFIKNREQTSQPGEED